MVLIRHLMLLLLQNNIQVKSKHIAGYKNTICDSISRFQWQKVTKVLPEHAAPDPCPVPEAFHATFK